MAAARKTSRTSPGRPPKVAVAAPASPSAPGEPPRPAAPLRAAADGRLHEPVWLVRIVLVLFLVGFAAFLAREVERFVSVLP